MGGACNGVVVVYQTQTHTARRQQVYVCVRAWASAGERVHGEGDGCRLAGRLAGKQASKQNNGRIMAAGRWARAAAAGGPEVASRCLSDGGRRAVGGPTRLVR